MIGVMIITQCHVARLVALGAYPRPASLAIGTV